MTAEENNTEKQCLEVLKRCIRAQCHYCAHGLEVIQFRDEQNLYHRGTWMGIKVEFPSPCIAYRIRRAFAFLEAVNG